MPAPVPTVVHVVPSVLAATEYPARIVTGARTGVEFEADNALRAARGRPADTGPGLRGAGGPPGRCVVVDRVRSDVACCSTDRLGPLGSAVAVQPDGSRARCVGAPGVAQTNVASAPPGRVYSRPARSPRRRSCAGRRSRCAPRTPWCRPGSERDVDELTVPPGGPEGRAGDPDRTRLHEPAQVAERVVLGVAA